MFHLKDGWCFTRQPNGNVLIEQRNSVIDRVVARVETDSSGWASMVAAMSARGENLETHNAARAFHDGCARIWDLRVLIETAVDDGGRVGHTVHVYARSRDELGNRMPAALRELIGLEGVHAMFRALVALPDTDGTHDMAPTFVTDNSGTVRAAARVSIVTL